MTDMPERPFLETYLYLRPGRRKTGIGNTPAAELVPSGRRAPAYLARQFHQILLGLLHEVLEPEGLTPAQWGGIVALSREPGVDQRGLCRRRSIDANSATRLIDELEALGIARRQVSRDDRRSNALYLTDRGQQLFLRLRPAVLAAQDRALAPLKQAEKRTFLELLERVVEGSQSYARPGNGRRRPVRKAPAPPIKRAP